LLISVTKKEGAKAVIPAAEGVLLAVERMIE
jgi:hypothetical protein